MSNTTPSLPGLTVFFPCYNEAQNIASTVAKAIPIIKQITPKYQVIVVNDGSKDNSSEVLAKLRQKYPFIEVINHPVNRGYGAAIKSGFYAAKYPWITFNDGDGQFDFSDITKFIETQQRTGADVVIGYYLGRQVSPLRIIGSKIWELAVFLLFGLRVTDIDCGFKLISKKVVDTIPKLEAERGPFISSEFLIKTKKAGFKIAEVGVRHYPRHAGAATGAQLKVILSGLRDLLRLRSKL